MLPEIKPVLDPQQQFEVLFAEYTAFAMYVNQGLKLTPPKICDYGIKQMNT